jgi:hypothetical protein
LNLLCNAGCPQTLEPWPPHSFLGTRVSYCAQLVGLQLDR